MFGTKKYVVYEKPSASDIFASLVVTGVIIAIIAMLVIYVGMIVLWIFLGIGGVIGLAYALFVYFRAFFRTIGSMSGYAPRHTGPIGIFLEKLFAFTAAASKAALTDNLMMAGSAVARSNQYRIISFRKWMWLVAALSIFVFGLALIVAVILLQFGLLFSGTALVLALVFGVCVIYLVSALGYGAAVSGGFAAGALRNEIDLSGYSFTGWAGFSDLKNSLSLAFSSYGRMLSSLWRDTLDKSRDNFSEGLSRGLTDIKKWLYMVSPVGLCLWAGIATALSAIVLPLTFLVMWIAQFFFILGVKFVSLFRH